MNSRTARHLSFIYPGTSGGLGRSSIQSSPARPNMHAQGLVEVRVLANLGNIRLWSSRKARQSNLLTHSKGFPFTPSWNNSSFFRCKIQASVLDSYLKRKESWFYTSNPCQDFPSQQKTRLCIHLSPVPPPPPFSRLIGNHKPGLWWRPTRYGQCGYDWKYDSGSL